jgi:hypothetical protein
VREEGEDSEHAEDVEDGLLQNLDGNGTLHNRLVRETPTWDLMFWSGLGTWATPIENAYFFLVIRTTIFTKKYNLSPSLFLEQLVPELIVQ